MSITMIGLDTAKSVFQVHAVDGAGQVVIRRKLHRDDAGESVLAGQRVSYDRVHNARPHWMHHRVIAFGFWLTSRLSVVVGWCLPWGV